MKRFLPLTILLILAISADLRAENAVRFSNATAQSGASFTVDMFIENDSVLGGITVPFRWSSPDITLQLIEAFPERWAGDMEPLYLVDPSLPGVSAVTVIHSLDTLTTGWIPTGDGPIARITFRVRPFAASQYAFLDSAYIVASGQPTRWVNWSSFLGNNTIVPKVYPGRITIGTPAAVTMNVTPSSVMLYAETGDVLPDQETVDIRSNNEVDFDWSASWGTQWLNVSPDVGKTPSFPTFNADPFFLLPGTYHDTVVITSDLADNSPISIPVTFVVDTAGARPPDGFKFSLGQSRPSPFVTYTAPETEIPFLLEEASHVSIAIFDLLGRQVRTLTSSQYSAGEASVVWDGRDALGQAAASGHYICRMSTAGGEQSRVIVLIR